MSYFRPVRILNEREANPTIGEIMPEIIFNKSALSPTTLIQNERWSKQNILNSNVSVFTCVQNDTIISNTEWGQWITHEMGDNLKHLLWFSLSEHADWISMCDKLMSNITLDNNWKKYLLSSGSIIEYFQLQLAYIQMCKYESMHGVYDFIIRIRTDTLCAKPLDFHWLYWSNDDVEKRLHNINTTLTLSNIEVNKTNTLSYFMTTIISDDI